MDAKSGLRHRKKQKAVRECEISENKDIISQLPDSLLVHILSMLSVNNAVRTCLVSMRWKDLWKSTTNLDFDCGCTGRTLNKKDNTLVDKWGQFIDQVFLSHSSSITRFSLFHSSSKSDPTHLESWISAAVQRQVQEVHLRIFSYETLLLPSCLYTSKTLRSLKVFSRCTFELPSTFLLSSLKILSLEKVVFLDDISLSRLFSGLPVLEELEIYDCNWKNIRNVTISLPTLKSLALSVRSYWYRNKAIEIKVNAENIINLNYECYLGENYLGENVVLGNMPSLANASIWIQGMGLTERLRAAPSAAKLFSALSFAKSLNITKESLQVLHENCNSEEKINLFPTFACLNTLEVDSKVTSYAGGVLMDILQKAPVLESIVFKEVSGATWCRKPYPQCIEFRLRKCTFLQFDGRPADIVLVKFLLKGGKVLERLKLYCTPLLCRRRKKLKDVKNELAKASNGCVIEYLKPYPFPPKSYWRR